MAGDALLGAVASAGGAVGRAVGDLFRAEGTLSTAPDSGQKFAVTKDNVLQAGKIIHEQIGDLKSAYGDAADKLRVKLDRADDVNIEIADAWNDRLVSGGESYAARIRQYIKSLENLVEQLRAAAKQYGYTDDEASAALGAIRASD